MLSKNAERETIRKIAEQESPGSLASGGGASSGVDIFGSAMQVFEWWKHLEENSIYNLFLHNGGIINGNFK